ncbi:hypothetical protein BDN72DRAFT_865305 [Pluteus cervinus]|uniref:Uncharacterized protein n=1 Tax=Pluteus cervinus TaxID=181527 RepID=A0ACD3A1S2_9AGAR|nr:hypothetical protein BDN72DRAFT_865305 [Pluteus cervinus]
MDPALYPGSKITDLLYPHELLNPGHLPLMEFQCHMGNLILCHKDQGRSYDGTHYLCRVRGQVLRDDLSPQPDARGYNGILVLQPSDNPELAKFFTIGVETLTEVQKSLNIPEGRLINAIQNVGGQQRLTIIATSMHGGPFRVKNNQGDFVPLPKDKLTFKGLEVDVVFTFYHVRVYLKVPGQREPKVHVHTIARLLEIQILI